MMGGIRTFEEALAEPNEEEKQMTPIDLELVWQSLTQLAQMLERGMVDSMEQIEELDRQLAHSELKSQWEQLKQEVDVFNLESALDYLHEIAKILNIT